MKYIQKSILVGHAAFVKQKEAAIASNEERIVHAKKELKEIKEKKLQTYEITINDSEEPLDGNFESIDPANPAPVQPVVMPGMALAVSSEDKLVVHPQDIEDGYWVEA